MNLKNKKVLVIDSGLYVAFAQRLARDFGTVYYCPCTYGAFPKCKEGMIGYGVPGLELVDSPFFDGFDDVDLFVFPDIGYGSMQEHFVSLGKRVWGSRMGEELEMYRADTKKLLRKIGLPVNEYTTVLGMAKLREHLKKHDDQFVKLDKWRGTFETFHARDYRHVEPLLDEVEHDLGPFKDVLEFIVESPLPDCVELGTDLYTMDGEYPKQCMSGIEIKDLGYAGIFKPFAAFPEPLTRVNKALAPILKQYQYRGPLSTEVRIGKDKKPYLIDLTCRLPSPPSELMAEMYTNISEIVWETAGGVMIEPKPAGKYGAQIIINSTWAEDNFQPVDFPDEYANNVKLYNPMCVNGRWYVIPQEYTLTAVGSVVATGNTWKEARDKCIEIAGTIKGYKIECELGSLDTVEEELAKSEKLGLKMF